MSEQKADKIQLEATKLVSFKLSSILNFDFPLLFGNHDSQDVKVPMGFTTATEWHLMRSQTIQVFC